MLDDGVVGRLGHGHDSAGVVSHVESLDASKSNYLSLQQQLFLIFSWRFGGSLSKPTSLARLNFFLGVLFDFNFLPLLNIRPLAVRIVLSQRLSLCFISGEGIVFLTVQGTFFLNMNDFGIQYPRSYI